MAAGVKVKGTIILDLVKQVRVAKDKDWGEYLLPEDWEIVNSEVLASRWYSAEFFYRLSLAVYKLIGESNMEVCFAYGKLVAHNMAEIYKNILVMGDPATSVERFLNRRKAFFIGDYPDAEKNRFERTEKGVKVRYYVEPAIRGNEVAPVMMYSILGSAHELVEITGGKNVRSRMEDRVAYFDLTVEWD